MTPVRSMVDFFLQCFGYRVALPDRIVGTMLSTFQVENREFLCAMLTNVGEWKRKPLTALFVLPHTESSSTDGTLFCIANESLMLGRGQGGTITMSQILWENVYVLHPIDATEHRENPVAYRKTYIEAGITGPAYILSEMLPLVEKVIREHHLTGASAAETKEE